MKFVLERNTQNSGRLGYLQNVKSEKKFKTPLLLQTTKSGSIPHLSREVFDYVSAETQVMQLSLSTIKQMAEPFTLYNDTFAAYVGYKDFPTILLINDPCEETKQGFNENRSVSIFTRFGKASLTPQNYLNLVAIFKPDIYQGLCDADTNEFSANKRINKASQHTEAFMDYCFQKHAESTELAESTLFVPIIGGFQTRARIHCVKHAELKGGITVGGYILDGFHSNGLTATTVSLDRLLPIVAALNKEIPPALPKLMPGAYTPIVVLKMITQGVDIFDTSYAYLAAANYLALTFNFNIENNVETKPFLNITDDCLKDDFASILADCSCLTCRKHTLAYLHHLYKTNELLGPMLLMIHNLHHCMEFFKTIRNTIESDGLPLLIKLIKYQHSLTEIDYSITAHNKDNKNNDADFCDNFVAA